MRVGTLGFLLVMLTACEHEFQSTDHVRFGHEHGSDEHADEDESPRWVDPHLRAAAAHVLVLEAEDTDQPTEVLGLIDEHEETGHHSEALERLRIKAASMGADAVIGVEFHHGEPGGEPAHLSGTAVRYRDLLRGRKYEVVGQLDVAGKMGDEGGAFSDLKARARALSADMIIGVTYHHGEGGDESPHLTGTAIRFR
jgi:uncharacterized protein YbjQ (UPF0145 family)